MMRMDYRDLYENLRHKLDQERGDRAAAESKLAITEQKLKWSEEEVAYERRRAEHAEEELAFARSAAEDWERMYDEACSGRRAVLEQLVNA